MDKMLSLIGFLIIALGAFAMYTPWMQLKESRQLTGKELSKEYPEHNWMRWGFISLYLSWIVAVYFFFTKVLPWMNIASGLAAIFASIALFEGFFALLTGVSIYPTRAPQVIFVVGDEAEKAGRFQVAWSIGVIVLAVAIEILLKHT